MAIIINPILIIISHLVLELHVVLYYYGDGLTDTLHFWVLRQIE